MAAADPHTPLQSSVQGWWDILENVMCLVDLWKSIKLIYILFTDASVVMPTSAESADPQGHLFSLADGDIWVARFPWEAFAQKKVMFFLNVDKTIPSPLNDVMQHRKCFLLLCEVISRSRAVDVLNFGGFASNATAALAVIQLSPLLQSFPFLHQIPQFESFPIFQVQYFTRLLEAPLTHLCLEVLIYSCISLLLKKSNIPLRNLL